jgi:hypothetical protein
MANWPWFNIVTMLVALYGAGLSTFNYRAQRRRDRRALKVEIVDPGDEGIFPPELEVSAVNTGFRSIHLDLENEHIVILKGREEIVDLLPFPRPANDLYELKEGKKITGNIAVNELSALLTTKGYKGCVKLRGRLVDTEGNTYRSRRHTYRIRTWKSKSNRAATVTQIPF